LAVFRNRESECHVRKAQALENVSLHVHKGGFVAVVGPNGAGKATLFNAVSGLIPFAATFAEEAPTLAQQDGGNDRAVWEGEPGRFAAEAGARYL
jgi:ABC-type Mn2+/Zn2+ transport system ATPase subunit